MKTTKFFALSALVAMFLLVSSLSAFAGKPEMTPAQHIQKMIKESIKYPEQAVKSCCQGSVDVIFKVDEDGKINIVRTFSTDEDVVKMVKDQLAGICCKGIKTPYNEHYKVTITFKLIG